MKVSVVMPTYNRAYIIKEAIESALAQTYRDFELIVVDDGSSDNTHEIIQQLAEERIRYTRHDQNRGYSAACNTGISAATGHVLGFLDSDDLWKPEYLERQVGFLGRHPEVDAVFSDTEIHNSIKIPSLIGLLKVFPRLLESNPGAGEFVFSGRQMYVCLLEEVPIKPTAFLVKREMLQRVGVFDEAWPSGTDWDLFIRLSQVACFGYVHMPLVVQRRTGDATHQKFREKDKLFLLNVFTKEKRGLQNDPEALQAINRGISDHCGNLGFLYLESGQRRKSMAMYFRGFKETGALGMLLRAVSALLPMSMRNLVKRTMKRRFSP